MIIQIKAFEFSLHGIIHFTELYQLNFDISNKFVPFPADMEPEFEGTTPKFIQKLQDVDAVSGKTARLECRVIGDPRPDIRWYRENEPLLEGGRYKFEDDDDWQVLVINDVCGSDEGLYKCVARNSAGKAHCSADLFVLRK